MKTVGDIVREIFPDGVPTTAEALRDEQAPLLQTSWTRTPSSPFDAFAVSAFLLMKSGAYHHVRPGIEDQFSGRRSLLVTADDRKLWEDAALAWRARPSPPPAVRAIWSKLRDAWNEPLFRELSETDAVPSWWKAALALMAISDNAACNAGFAEASDCWINALADTLILEAQASGTPISTISLADPDVVCVLPKSRTPAVGCTLRSLSHNLALLPSRGLARALWTRWDTLRSTDPSINSGALNLLLVPYPYELPATAVKASLLGEGEGYPWGWFTVEPAHGEETQARILELVEFVRELLRKAEKDVGEIHGVVFPELSLSRAAYVAIFELLEGVEGVEFLIAGTNEAPDGRKGNFAALAGFVRGADQSTAAIEFFQQKHHRWRLDRNQIEGYAVGASIDPNRLWWEDLHITSRSLAVATLRSSITVSTLICEDLARVDPAQEVLRALGPNLVVALLMDGPQLQGRWSARYATVLAEDPGSSVLSFTSLGLISRTNATGRFDRSRAIGLWRDDLGERTIKLPDQSAAVVLTLSPAPINESTLDGREDGHNSHALRLSGIIPIEGAPPATWCA